MPNGTYGGVRGRKTKVGRKLLRFPPTRFRPAWAYSNGCKSLSRPDNGKATAKDKGVRGDAESEGSRRQTSALTDRNMI